MPSEARQKKIMEKLNRAQKCSILGPQNLGSRGGPGPGAPPASAPEMVVYEILFSTIRIFCPKHENHYKIIYGGSCKLVIWSLTFTLDRALWCATLTLRTLWLLALWILISRYQTRYLDKVSALPAGCYNEITVEAPNLIKVPIWFLCLKHWSIHGIAFID